MKITVEDGWVEIFYKGGIIAMSQNKLWDILHTHCMNRALNPETHSSIICVGSLSLTSK